MSLVKYGSIVILLKRSNVLVYEIQVMPEALCLIINYCHF
uniref:Uncharacterized protein n=1 Tax=Anguilla anguilla TaxID=7936 RepID=A0A0E9RRQ4_ANGAN